MDTIIHNLTIAGYPFTSTEVNREGIANALNDGIDFMMEGDYDAVAFMANDIIEPKNWLADKVHALETYPGAGIVASSVNELVNEVKTQLIIGNWLISRRTVDRIGYFNESMFPYGPIDLDYCDRCSKAGIGTYYVMNCMSEHPDDKTSRTKYGYDKQEVVDKFYPKFMQDSEAYRHGSLSVRRDRGI
jgi:GT2 family glycosyltransferase